LRLQGLVAWALASLLSGCGSPFGSVATTGLAAGGAARPVLAVRRGDVAVRMVLTGEIKAAQEVQISAPRTPSFNLTIRSMADDGSLVAAGQPVIQFDNSSFVEKLDQQRLSAAAAADELNRIEADARAQAADKSLAVDQARTDLAKAQITAAVPPELLSRFDYQDRQIKRQQAETALAKAEEDLAQQRAAARLDASVQRLALDQANREVAASEAAIREMTIRAPRPGLLLIANHPWEGRKLQIGDEVWTGMKIASLPEVSSMIVEAALSDVDDGRVRPGMPATCFLDAYPEAPLRCRVAEVSAVARESGRTALLRYFSVRVELAQVPPAQAARLRPGMSVRVEVAATERRQALLVPRGAIALLPVRAEGGNSTTGAQALLAGGGTARIRLGPCDSFWCVAESGVSDGEALRSREAGGE
jgi:multidrug resistance efflux pump